MIASFCLELISYLTDPQNILTHAIAAGLFTSMFQKGISGRSLAILLATEELLVYLSWKTLPHGISAVIAIWICLRVYEHQVAPSVDIKSNAIFIADKSSLAEITKLYENLSFELQPYVTEGESRKIRTSLFYIVVGNTTQISSSVNSENDTVIPIEDISDITFGCQSSVTKWLSYNSINESERCFTVQLASSNKEIVLIADDVAVRDQWVQLLQHWSGNKFVDLRAAWLSKLRSSIQNKQACLGEDVRLLDKADKVTLDEALAILSEAGRPFDRNYANDLFKTFSGVSNIKAKLLLWETKLTKDQLYAFFSFTTQKPEITEIFERLLKNSCQRIALHPLTFWEFIRTEQKEEISAEKSNEWISKYEPVLNHLKVSHIGFANYLLAEEHNIFRNDFRSVYQDMTRPLSHYFIATSHNTYLTKDQLTSKSSVEMYITAFKRGSKCVELDVWDGANNEPVIYHGYTLTSKILLKDVLQAIKQHAFSVSDYPVILSFENHCSLEQQKVIAQYIQDILGDMLYLNPIQDVQLVLPSPEELKGYILIKAKKAKLDGTEEVDVDDEEDELSDELLSSSIADDNSIGDKDTLSLNSDNSKSDTLSLNSMEFDTDTLSVKSETFDCDSLSEKLENDDDEDSNATWSLRGSIKKRKVSAKKMREIISYLKKTRTEKDKMKASKIAQELSDLVVYCQPSSFKGYENARNSSKFYEMISLAEKRSQKMAREDAVAMLQYNELHLCRVYPSGSRIDSSNFDPIQLWNTGCQLVALNYQTPCSAMQLNSALFNDNGGCGYVLKPEFMCIENITFDPRIPSDHLRVLSVKVISGCQIPYKNEKVLKSERNLSVQVRITGVENDAVCERTKIVRNTGLNPIWNEEFVFHLHVPELAFVVFTVLSKDSFVAQYTIPYRCMQKGYRRVPLLNKSSESFPFSYLFIHSSESCQ